MLINSVESLVRDGYQIHVTLGGEVYVYFSTESQERQHEVWNRDIQLIEMFLAGRHVCGYYSMVAREIRAISPERPVAPAPAPAAEAPAPAPKPFKPVLKTLPSSPKKKKFVLNGATEEEEYSIYTKEDGTLHIHWLLRREEAKQVWRRDREKIQTWLGGRTLNTVSWRKYNNK
jgi:hypothetical protein